MTFRNRYLFIAVILFSIIGLIFQWAKHGQIIDGHDLPRQLLNEKVSLDLVYVNRHCECPEWIEVSRLKDSTHRNEDDFLFIEPATGSSDIPVAYWAIADSGYVFRVTGSFYKVRGIPGNYIQKTDHKPEKARVFSYTGSEVVKPE